MRRKYVPPHLRGGTTTTTTSISTAIVPSRNMAQQRLGRDLAELQRSNILSIAAHPIDNTIFEWHANIKPIEGVYSGVYLHLIMLFPQSYPFKPPTIKICTPISHPNIFNKKLCLSMLRPHTANKKLCLSMLRPYEGWSSAYSVTSILMQLQSFLFAEKIDQDYGNQKNARLSNYDVKKSITICKTFQCKTCNHSHYNPWPKLKELPNSVIKIIPTKPSHTNLFILNGSSIQTTYDHWTAVRADFGCSKEHGKVMYEAFIHWGGDRWSQDNVKCRFGFGSNKTSICGCDIESFGYGGTGMYSYDYNFNKLGEMFAKDDTITVGIDFNNYRIYFAKNGRLMHTANKSFVPEYLKDKMLFPVLAFKNSSIEFNFGIPKKACLFLLENGFKTLDEIKKSTSKVVCKTSSVNSACTCNWQSQYIIPELWVCIFEGLIFEDMFCAQFVCKEWYDLINKYNLMDRNEILCYFTKSKLCSHNSEILGIGLSIRSSNIEGHGISIHSQWDILCLTAWNNGCKTGVWGEELTHFLPLVLTKKHSRLAETEINCRLWRLTKIFCTIRRSNCNELERDINKTNCLKFFDTLVTMMNLIVVQFVMGNKNVNAHNISMIMCEKVVLGYCMLHHLLLYLVSKNKEIITNFANKCVSLFINDKYGCHKKVTRDLGKFLIYLMISDYKWNDIAEIFIKEAITRSVLWMVNDIKYIKYDTTNIVNNRLENTFNACLISNRLIMFQVWFMKNNSSQTLHKYNQRLGKPNIKVKNAIFNKTKCILLRFAVYNGDQKEYHRPNNKTKCILNNKLWSDYFNELDVTIKDNNCIDQLLRFAVYNSDQKGYHRPNMSSLVKCINAPKILVKQTFNQQLFIYENDIKESKCDQYIVSKQPKMSKLKGRKLQRKKENGNSKWISSIRPQSMKSKGKNRKRQNQ